MFIVRKKVLFVGNEVTKKPFVVHVFPSGVFHLFDGVWCACLPLWDDCTPPPSLIKCTQ